jgi:hypothetical protein
MSDDQRQPQWLARWRAKRHLKRQGPLRDKLFGAADGDSEEKIAQRHTNRGRELDAEDRRHRIKGGAGGGLQ